jgi:GntR family transcriptional regulator
LVDEAVLVRRQGKGTFVALSPPKIVHSIDRLAPFMETFQKAGEQLKTELISFGWRESPELPRELDGWERPVLMYQRLYISSGIPHAVTQVVLSRDIGRRISHADVEAQPIYGVLETKLGLSLSRADFLVSCRLPSPRLCETLELSQSTFLLVLERITRDIDGRPVEMTTHFLRPDIYQLSVALRDVDRRRP